MHFYTHFHTSILSCRWIGTSRALTFELECTIIEGDLTLSMITEEEDLNDEKFPVFENLREITGALLIFQIKCVTFS